MTAAAKVASQFIAFMHRSRQFVQKVSPLASWLGKKSILYDHRGADGARFVMHYPNRFCLLMSFSLVR
jgi:hypothetical protein